MRVDLVTIFPEYLEPLRVALLGKAIERGTIQVAVHDLRNWTHDVHRSVDDAPYGGGPGMVMKPEVWGPCLDDVCPDDALLVVPTPAGRPFRQETAVRWSTEDHLVFACGRYEGIDQRVVDDAARRVRVEEVSLGDFVLIGGEVAAMAMIEATARLIPGVLGNPRSHQEDSFSDGLLEGPSYTRPEVWRDLAVPPVLLSGDHAKISRWRHDRALERTRERRPDLLASLTPEASSGEPPVDGPAAAPPDSR
ncbi:tRNA (guanosine(37)-N1)-methyltransferase TrmD [Gordonia sinesedis]